MSLDLFYTGIDNIEVLENFKKIEDFLELLVLDRGKFQHFEITFTGAVTNYKYPHNLGFQPKDVIQTSLTGAGSLTWNYGKFDKTYLDITVTGACVVRAFVGNYRSGSDA